MKQWLIFLTFIATASLLFTGCGYRMKSELDPKYQTIAISAFYDETREYDLQAPLTNALVRKFINDGRLRVAPPDDADLLLEGKITKYQLKGMTYDAHDETTQFGLVICAAARLRDQQTGETLWEEPLFAGETTFYTRAFGQSSDRLRGNAEAFIPSVRSFSTEEENRAASEALEQLASDIFYRTVELW